MLPAMFFWVPGTEGVLEERYGKKQVQSIRKPQSFRMFLAVAMLVASAGLFMLIGCAGKTPYAGPASGQQTVTVTANGSNGVNQSISVQVTIQ